MGQCKVVIVGGGSSAHVLIPLLSSAGHSVDILTQRPHDWSHEVVAQLQSPRGELERSFRGTLSRISNKPSEIIPSADIVVLCMPVSKYRLALHNIAPHIRNDKDVFVGTVYGQGGFNWMVDEVRHLFGLNNVSVFAIGLLPWVCRTISYGAIGVMYGSKKVNVAAVCPSEQFEPLNRIFLRDTCERWFGVGAFRQSDNFLSLTLSVDNQIIHPSRCYGLFLRYGGEWQSEDDVPYFYRDYDQLSADLLRELDNDYSTIRDAIRKRFPREDFTYMLDYLALERLSYQSENTDICESFTTSRTLGAIKTPTIQTSSGKWVIDTNHRFFTDDIHYGLCIAKWIANELQLNVPYIDKHLRWAQFVTGHKIIDGSKLLPVSERAEAKWISGIPTVYGFHTINDIFDHCCL